MKSSITIGSTFANKEFKVLCHALATRENFEFMIIKSDHYHFTIKCLREECPWRLHVSMIINIEDKSFEMTTLNTLLLSIAETLRGTYISEHEGRTLPDNDLTLIQQCTCDRGNYSHPCYCTCIKICNLILIQHFDLIKLMFNPAQMISHPLPTPNDPH